MLWDVGLFKFSQFLLSMTKFSSKTYKRRLCFYNLFVTIYRNGIRYISKIVAKQAHMIVCLTTARKIFFNKKEGKEDWYVLAKIIVTSSKTQYLYCGIYTLQIDIGFVLHKVANKDTFFNIIKDWKDANVYFTLIYVCQKNTLEK